VLRPTDPILDERVARAKFAAAERIYANRALFTPRGWRILEPAFPQLTVMFDAPGGRTIGGVRLQLRNFDFLPPSVTFLDADEQLHTVATLGLLLRPFEQSHVPPAIRDGFMLIASTGGYLPGMHPFTQLPFLCIRGTWEFHVHPQHADIQWEWIRSERGYGLQYLIEQARGVFQEELFR
jgi:hypothetical protein